MAGRLWLTGPRRHGGWCGVAHLDVGARQVGWGPMGAPDMALSE